MRLTSEALRELFQRETTRSARGRNNDCPSVEMLTSAAAGELSHAERDVIGDHLATCSDCANEYRSIRSLKPWAENSSRDFATAATENGAGPVRLLHLPDRQTNVYQPSRKNLAGSRLFSFYVPVALAVLFLILALALAAQLISQRRENQRLVAQANEKRLAQEQQNADSFAESRRLLEEATERAERAEAAQRAAQEELTKRSVEQQRGSQSGFTEKTRNQVDYPLVNVPIFELHPRGSTRELEAGAIATLEAAPDTNLITLILHVNGELSRDDYSIEVLNHAGRMIWSGRGLRKSRYNNFTVAIPRRTFPAGDYRLRLYGSRDGRRELIEEYAIHIQYR